jgi:hypothetical protein
MLEKSCDARRELQIAKCRDDSPLEIAMHFFLDRRNPLAASVLVSVAAPGGRADGRMLTKCYAPENQYLSLYVVLI